VADDCCNPKAGQVRIWLCCHRRPPIQVFDGPLQIRGYCQPVPKKTAFAPWRKGVKPVWLIACGHLLPRKGMIRPEHSEFVGIESDPRYVEDLQAADNSKRLRVENAVIEHTRCGNQRQRNRD